MPRKYAVALSYPGAHRSLVHTVANHLRSTLARLDGAVFLDLYNQIKFEGKVDESLKSVYREQCDLAVVFLSREYFESEWCKMEWSVLHKFMLSNADSPRVLMIKLDRSDPPQIPGHLAVDAQLKTAEEISRTIFNEMNVTPWIADARFAGRTLSAMSADRDDWAVDLEIRESLSGKAHWGATSIGGSPTALTELCRGHYLDWNGRAPQQLPANIICLCAPTGAGKSVVLLRAIASAGTADALPEHSWIVDFSNNKDACRDISELESVPAGELKKFLGTQLKADPRPDELFLAIDGLDSAARHLSVRTDEMTAPRMTLRTLRSIFGKLRNLGTAAGKPIRMTVVVTLNAPRNTAAPTDPQDEVDQGTWRGLLRTLEEAGAIFADLQPLPAVDKQSFQDIYDAKLKLPEAGVAAAAEYVADNRDFLRLPLFLDAASQISPGELRDCKTRADFLLKAQKHGRACTWPSEIDELAIQLGRFIGAIQNGLHSDDWLRSMLRREWTGAWVDLLTEAMKRGGVEGGMQELMNSLLDEHWRWDLSASYALSNVLTALCEAGCSPPMGYQLRYYNLRRATLDNIVFGKDSVLLGVDCTGASLKNVELISGCKFIATDFSNCTWDTKPERGAPAFVECSGL